MKKSNRLIVLALFSGLAIAEQNKPLAVANGLEIPVAYKNWQLINVSHRTDNQTLRVTLGNPIAIKAARSGKIKPWPEGSILAKIVWKDSEHPQWQAATVPDALVHAEFMTKNSKKYTKTGGWGFSRWNGMQQIPYGKDASFEQECFSCHQAVKTTDWVFTQVAPLP